MSRLLSNKKLLLGIVSVMVGVTVLMAGLTYAWFTNSGTATRDDITMGTVKMSVTLGNPDMLSVDEPGGNIPNQVAYIRNLGTIHTLAKLKFSTTTTIKSDSNGDPLSTWYTIENDPKVKITLQEDGELGYSPTGPYPPEGLPLRHWFTDDGEIFSWIKYKDEYYVGMTVTTDETGIHPQPEDTMTLPFLYTVELSNTMGNEYQNAEVDIKVDWIATQSFAEESFTELFGIDEADIVGFENTYAIGRIGVPNRFIDVEDYLRLN